jgi:hypothetical protein
LLSLQNEQRRLKHKTNRLDIILNVIVNLIQDRSGMMVKVMLPILGLLLLAACNDSGSPAARPRFTFVPMDAQAWAILYSPGMPAHPSSRETGGWYFDFPSAPGSVHYVTAAVNMIASKNVSANIEVTTTGTPTFEYALEANNTCVNPAHVRFYCNRKATICPALVANNFTGGGRSMQPMN